MPLGFKTVSLQRRDGFGFAKCQLTGSRKISLSYIRDDHMVGRLGLSSWSDLFLCWYSEMHDGCREMTPSC